MIDKLNEIIQLISAAQSIIMDLRPHTQSWGTIDSLDNAESLLTDAAAEIDQAKGIQYVP